MTKHDGVYKSDRFFPQIPPNFVQHKVTDVNEHSYYAEYKQHQEYQYIELICELLTTGEQRIDRTGIGTLALFGKKMTFSLRDSFPLLTTKRVFWRGVVEELLWFLSGSTNTQDLRDVGVHIWDGNTNREFLDKNGFKDRKEYELGPGYGFLWRNFGAKWREKGRARTKSEEDEKSENDSDRGVEQIAELDHALPTNPTGRRHILTAWNPKDLKNTSLPPCHILSQFYINNNKELSCQLYQRSADVGLGVPFNIASYSLLTCMIAHILRLKRGDFIHILGDAHIYKTHVKPLREQIKRSQLPFPTLQLRDGIESLDDFTRDDIKILNYSPHKKIDMKMTA